jgi:hypothetical protein
LKVELPDLAGWVLTMLFEIISWVLFRAVSFTSASSMIKSMFGGNGFTLATADYGAHLVILILAAAVALIGPSSQIFALEHIYDKPWAALATASMLTLSIIMAGSVIHSEFIYFQF